MDATAGSIQERGAIMRTIVETSKGYVLIDTCDTADHGLETMVFRCTEDGTGLLRLSEECRYRRKDGDGKA